MIGICCFSCGSRKDFYEERWEEMAGGNTWICVCFSSLGNRRYEFGPSVLHSGPGQQQPPRRGLQQPGRAGDAEGPRGAGQWLGGRSAFFTAKLSCVASLRVII